MQRRLPQTLADYLVIAISPALIMTLVGSLVFFVLSVVYQGEYAGRLHWVMFCFVFAAVLISRISIEEGWERAMPFGAALAIAVGLACNKFVEVHGEWIDRFGFLVNWALIAIIWWCAARLTWDCTVIDEQQDASGEGLLQIAGLERPPEENNNAVEPVVLVEPPRLEGTTIREQPVGWWDRHVEHQRRPHAPGVWVVYFSLAALPLFGMGQWFIPADNLTLRRWSFFLLCIYVASGLALLVTTSFLGLRRYLRQRKLEMPPAMAGMWLASGAAIIVGLLVLSALIPRPAAEVAISQLPFTVGSPQAKASRAAPVPREGVDDDQPGQAPRRDTPDEPDEPDPANDKPTNSTSDKPDSKGSSPSDSKDHSQASNDKGAKSNDSKQSAGQKSDSRGDDKSPSKSDAKDQKSSPSKQPSHDSQKQDNKGSDDKSPADKSQDDRQDKSKQPNDTQPPARDKASPPPANRLTPPPIDLPLAGAGNLFKYIFYALAALVVCYALWRYWAQIWQSIRNFLAELAEFWARLWGGGRSRRTLAAGAEPDFEIPPPPFSSFADPFAGGTSSRYGQAELVRYSFEAFEAWAREHGCPRVPAQTPHELVRDVSQLARDMAGPAKNLAELYARAAYAEPNTKSSQRDLPSNTVEQLRQLWQQMRSTAPQN